MCVKVDFFDSNNFVGTNYNKLPQFVIEDFIMTTSMATDKENNHPSLLTNFTIPSHQGRAFKIQLGNNNGPFLSKDVMYSNQKSTCLMAAKQILQSHKSMASLMTTLNRQEENQSSTIRNSSKVESWFGKCQFIEEELKYMQGELKKLSIEEARLKLEVKISFANLIRANEDLTHSFRPLFRNLLNRIRDQNYDQKHLFEQKKRDLEELTTFRYHYLDELVGCERRIIKVEQFLGIAEQPASSP